MITSRTVGAAANMRRTCSGVGMGLTVRSLRGASMRSIGFGVFKRRERKA